MPKKGTQKTRKWALRTSRRLRATPDPADLDLRQFGWYVRNCAYGPFSGRLKKLIMERLPKLSGEQPGDDPLEFDLDDTEITLTERRYRQRALRRVLKNYADPPRDNDNLERNVAFTRAEFGLDDIDIAILLLIYRYERNEDLEGFADAVFMGLFRIAMRTIAALIGVDSREVGRHLEGTATLITSGVLSINENGDHCGLAGESGFLRLAPRLRAVMNRGFTSHEEWLAAVIGKPQITALTWEDFEHLGSVRELAVRLVAHARQSGAVGINLLVHGPVGTGKTEFSKVLAARVGMSVWSVGEADDGGGEPSRTERLASLRVAQRLLAARKDGFILFDEAEDFLAFDGSQFGSSMHGGRHGSRVFTHRMLESNPVPMIWTCNYVAAIDPAVLRRMSLAIEIKTPNQPVRARIWRRALSDAEVTLEESAVQRLSGRYEAPPAVAASAARAVALAGGGEAEIEQAMTGVLDILGIGPLVPDADGRAFDSALVNCRENLAALAERLASSGASRQWSLCLHGATGTGKSQFARYLATRLGMAGMQRRASDLLSKWVGGSEQRIAAAFREARAQRALLIFDEADSLLQDRRDAVRSWEVSQVNEMLTWMENHPLPFICTTNLMDRLDQASLRRFTFKLRLDPFPPHQAALAFERFFGEPAPRTLPEGLTPGDFVLVRRKRDLFGVASASALADWLKEEVDAKELRPRPIGFGR